MTLAKETRILGGLAAAFAMLVLATLMFLNSVGQHSKTAVWVAHTKDVLAKINGLVAYLSDAENGRRGYVLTGNHRYLGHFTNGVVQAGLALRELRELTSDNPHQIDACAQLQAMIAERLAISTNSINAYQERGQNGPAQNDFMDRGQQAMERIRQVATGMMEEETALLNQRQAIRDKNQKWTERFGLLVALFGLVSFLALFILFTRANRRRHQAEDALRRTNLELERRVKDRTSELMQTVERLTQAEAIGTRFAALVESSDDAIVTKTLGGVITTWNPGAKKLFGYSAEEAIGKPMLMLIPAERAGEEPEILARIASGQTVDHFETERIHKDGKRIDVSVTISPIRDGQGRITGASKIARDITQRKLAEQKLAAQLARLDLLSRTTRAIGERQDLPSIFQVVIRNVEDHLPIDFGCVCLVEAARESMTITSVGIKSRPLALELAMTDNARISIDQNGLSRCVRGELVYESDIRQVAFPFPQRLARGGLRSLVIAPLLVESTVFGVLVAARREPNSFSSGECEFLRQLSEHVALAAHQAQLYKALETAFADLRRTQQTVTQQERLRALGQMASGIAHNINNAITPAAIYTESLLESEPNLSQRARDYLQVIDHAIADVAATVGSMREFYRQREPQLTAQSVRLNDLVDQVVNLTRARWSDMPQRRGVAITMRTELAPGLPVIQGVEGEIREALINLIFNAVDAMPDGGTLTVRTRVGGNEAESGNAPSAKRVQVEVADTGVGMDEETRRRCLEPFFTTKGERGTGLGLPMVYGVAQRHGAELEIDSALGKGTTMRLAFPAMAGAVAERSESEPVSAPPVRLRILVVDDDPILLKSLQDTLENDGHVVVTANGGQAGINAFLGTCSTGMAFALVITDLGMANVDGRRVASVVKEASPSTPVLLLTGWGQRLAASGDTPAGVDCVLSKPPKLRELRHALARCRPGAAS